MRDLTVLENTNLAGSKEFNHVRVANLEEFLNGYSNKYDYYKSPFAILADLEQQVMYENNPDGVLCEYKDGGDIIFNFVKMYEDGDRRVVEYEYASSVS